MHFYVFLTIHWKIWNINPDPVTLKICNIKKKHTSSHFQIRSQFCLSSRKCYWYIWSTTAVGQINLSHIYWRYTYSKSVHIRIYVVSNISYCIKYSYQILQRITYNMVVYITTRTLITYDRCWLTFIQGHTLYVQILLPVYLLIYLWYLHCMFIRFHSKCFSCAKSFMENIKDSMLLFSFFNFKTQIFLS